MGSQYLKGGNPFWLWMRGREKEQKDESLEGVGGRM